MKFWHKFKPLLLANQQKIIGWVNKQRDQLDKRWFSAALFDHTPIDVDEGSDITAPPVHRAIRFGAAVLGGFLLIFGGWAVFAPLESAAIAPGKITVDTYRKTIQHLEGGIIKSMLAREGSMVKAGELLMTLDDTRAKAALEVLRNRLETLRAEEARLIAERDNADDIDFPEDLLASKNSPRITKILKGQQILFDANKNALADQLTILKQRIEQLEKQIESLNSQVESSSKQLALIEEEITAVKYLEERQLIEKPRLLALQREAARLLGNRGEDIGRIAAAQQKIGETKTQIISLKSNQQQKIAEQLRTVQHDLEDVFEREKAAVDVLARTKIYAPRAGTVVGLKFHTIGAVITPGTPIMDIVPSQDILVITARVDPLDIDIVHPGLLARVQLSAYKQRHLPKLDGIVNYVSADSLHDPNSDDIYYEARVTITPEAMKLLPENVHLYPGMPAQVMIIVNKRTPWNYFITPIKDTFDQAFREQ